MSKPVAAVVFGTRPEAIKLAPVIEALRARPGLETRIVATAQHREMLDQMLHVFDLRPDADLDLMRPGQTLDEVTARILTETGKVFDAMKPSLVLVEGDTTTVFASALAAFYRRIPVGHVEAGLRSFQRYSPFPEEINRRLAGVLSDLYFAPTERARRNLLAEGFDPATIHVTGNTVVDAVRSVLARTQEPDLAFLDGKQIPIPKAQPPMNSNANPNSNDGPHTGHTAYSTQLPESAGQATVPTSYPPTFISSDSRVHRKLVLVTAHRRESFGQPLRDALRTIKRIAESREDVQFVYPVHPNPNVRAAVADVFGSEEVKKIRSYEEEHPGDSDSFLISYPHNFLTSNILLTPPLSYIPFVHLMKRAHILLTDSGGIQEEGTALGKPILVLREVTERPEGVEAGGAELVGTDPARIEQALTRLLDDADAYGRMARARDVFGDGKAGERIAGICEAFLRSRAGK